MTPSETAVDFASPSLAGRKALPAYELKFLIPDAVASQIEEWARQRLALDPHGDPALGGAYRTISLYCDTPQLDVYHRSPFYKRSKFRVRRYDTAPNVFLERKSKWGDRVAKRRTAIAREELTDLSHPMPVLTWPGHWFHRRLQARRLGPACRVVYTRTAFVGAAAEGPLRLTLDRHVHGILTNDWNFDPVEGGLPLLTSQVILELKFRLALPGPFKELVQAFQLSPGTFSKYRRCREAWGVPPPARQEAAHA